MHQNDDSPSKETLYKEIKNNEQALSYLRRHYSETSIDSFLSSYAGNKSVFIKYGEQAATQAEKRDERAILEAQNCLLEIQRKKLFDKMCAWNANQFTHPSVLCSWDFYNWENDLLACPFIAAISSEEFNLYMQYANTADFKYEYLIELIQCDGILSNENSDDDNELPEWFVFENTFTGNHQHLLLPKLRVPKELFYRRLASADRQKDIPAPPVTDMPKKPFANAFHYDEVKDFIAACESKEVMEKFIKFYDNNPEQLIRSNEEDNRNGFLDEQVTNIFFEWKGIKDIIPVQANADWRQALVDAYEQYRRQQVIHSLPYVYEDYCMRLQNGFGFGWQQSENNYMAELAQNVRKDILLGRKFNNEPEDFNF